jgi:hypothetical protein
MLGATIAWLSGAAAGIGAIFYAFGYLITLANLQMLGLDLAALRYDPTFYIGRGAGFVLLSAVYAAQGPLPPLILLALGYLIAFLGGPLLHKHVWRLAMVQPFRSFTQHQEVWKTLAYPLLLLLLYLQLPNHFWFPEEMSLSGVLYSARDGGPAGDSIWKSIVCGEGDLLQRRFRIFVDQQVWIGVLLLLAWGLNRARRWGALWTAPFVVVFAISTVWLPLEYGKLALLNKFPQALVQFEHPMETAGGPVIMYLVKQDRERVRTLGRLPPKDRLDSKSHARLGGNI